jgi:hypothetical protein
MSKAPGSLKEIIGSVQLAGVRLSELTAAGNLPEDGVRNALVEIAHSAKVKDRTSDRFMVTATITVRMTRQGRGKRAIRHGPTTTLSLQAAFDLLYELPKAKDFSAAALSHFANVNGVYNAWPYWRELVQSITVRMGLPPVVLPVFRIAPPGQEQSTE